MLVMYIAAIVMIWLVLFQLDAGITAAPAVSVAGGMEANGLFLYVDHPESIPNHEVVWIRRQNGNKASRRTLKGDMLSMFQKFVDNMNKGFEKPVKDNLLNKTEGDGVDQGLFGPIPDDVAKDLAKETKKSLQNKDVCICIGLCKCFSNTTVAAV